MHNPQKFVFKSFPIRPVTEQDIPALRRLVNAAYQELADRGLNYTATYQDEDVTRKRIARGTAYVVEKENGDLVGTVLFRQDNRVTGTRSAYISQLAVAPDMKGQGLGNVLMDLCESLAQEQNYEAVQLDTAQPAEHLVSWYLRRGYQVVGEAQWEGKTYKSLIFEKTL